MLWKRFRVLILVTTLASAIGCKRNSAEPAPVKKTVAPATVDATQNASENVQQDRESVSPAAEVEGDAQGAAAWAAGMCAKCHTSNGKGGPRAPDLTDNEWLHCDGTVGGIRAVLLSGVPRDKFHDPSRPFEMNPVTNLVPDEKDLNALAVYVHRLSR